MFDSRIPGIGMVLHWQPPDVHISGTHPSLLQSLNFLHLTVSEILHGQEFKGP